MRYVKTLQIVVAAGILLGLVHALIYLLAAPGSRVHGFIYDRSFVQHATLLITCLVVVLLFARTCQYRYSHAQYTALARQRGGPPKELAEALNAISETRRKHGMEAATAHAERVARRNRELPGLGLGGSLRYRALDGNGYNGPGHGLRRSLVRVYMAAGPAGNRVV